MANVIFTGPAQKPIDPSGGLGKAFAQLGPLIGSGLAQQNEAALLRQSISGSRSFELDAAGNPIIDETGQGILGPPDATKAIQAFITAQGGPAAFLQNPDNILKAFDFLGGSKSPAGLTNQGRADIGLGNQPNVTTQQPVTKPVIETPTDTNQTTKKQNNLLKSLEKAEFEISTAETALVQKLKREGRSEEEINEAVPKNKRIVDLQTTINSLLTRIKPQSGSGKDEITQTTGRNQSKRPVNKIENKQLKEFDDRIAFGQQASRKLLSSVNFDKNTVDVLKSVVKAGEDAIDDRNELLKEQRTRNEPAENLNLGTEANAILFAEGVSTMEDFFKLPPERQNIIRNKIGSAASDDRKTVKISEVKNLTDRDGNFISTGFFVTTVDLDTMEVTGEMNKIENGQLIVSSVTASSPQEVDLQKTTQSGLEQQILQISSAENALSHFMESTFKGRTDNEINGLLGAAGGVSRAISTTIGQLKNMESTFFDKKSFMTNFIAKRPIVARIINKLAPESAAFYAEYAFALYKTAVAASEGGGRALSDKDIDRIRPMINIREALQMRKSIEASIKILRSDRQLKIKFFNEGKNFISQLEGSDSIMVDEQGNIIKGESLRKKIVPSDRSKTLDERAKELF